MSVFLQLDNAKSDARKNARDTDSSALRRPLSEPSPSLKDAKTNVKRKDMIKS
jgi:hypothetical protein